MRAWCKTSGQYLFKTRNSRWCYSSVTYALLLHLTRDVWDSVTLCIDPCSRLHIWQCERLFDLSFVCLQITQICSDRFNCSQHIFLRGMSGLIKTLCKHQVNGTRSTGVLFSFVPDATIKCFTSIHPQAVHGVLF